MIRRLIPIRWMAAVAGIAVAVGLLWGVLALIEAATTRDIRHRRCPECGGPLDRTGVGFYDGLVPGRWELAWYLLTIAITFIALILVRLCATRP